MQESNDESRTVEFLQDWPKCGCGKAWPILEEVTSGGFRVTCYGCKMMTFTFETVKDAVKCWSDRHKDMLEQDETMFSNLKERTTCLVCSREFNSWDKRKNRVCPRCSKLRDHNESGGAFDDEEMYE